MKAKRITVFLMALTLAVALSACGNINSAQEIKESEVETEELKEAEEEETETAEAETEELEAAVEEVAESEEAVESKTEKTEMAKTEASASAQPTTVPAQTSEPTTAPVQSAQPTAEPSAPAQTTAPVQSAQPTAEPSAPAQTTALAQSAQPTAEPSVPTATPTPEPVHEHSWKEHVATTQVWVPNIVAVDDYETKTVAYTVCICDCGFETTDANTIRDHIREHAYAGDIKGFTSHDQSYTEQVKIGSHEEDQGHYETNSYVDYYYCDCGERK